MVALVMLLVGLHQLGGAVLIKAKAWMAPLLIEQAWQQTLSSGGQPMKPWSWADTWPVGRLRVPSLDIERLVLAGDSGNALAFGPGHTSASAQLGSHGLAVIGGHRDTHFAFLSQVQVGQEVQLELPSGAMRSYRVQGTRVVNADQEMLAVDTHRDVLLLVTCYPFDALRAGGPLRYVVSATPLD
jgi:sortase A